MTSLNERDLNLIRKLHSETEQDVNTSTRNFFGVDDFKKKLLSKILTPYLKPIIGNFEIGKAVASNSYNPGEIHTDYYEITGNPHYAILIPLETVNSHTVVFKEGSKVSFEEWMPTAKKADNNCAYLHDTILNHIPKEELEFVTLDSISKWDAGSLIIWHMLAFHTSDNFIGNGLTNKKSFIIFTQT
jgi:hypothetical protein